MRKQGIKVGDAVSEALKTMEESEIMRAVSTDQSFTKCPSRPDQYLDFTSICRSI